ncbi:hypothetical protein [Paracoccus thiocyanatus]|nr:hypothetical protein [Paracoccus thiocyanatus]
MSEARITRHVGEHHAVQGEAEYVNRAASERAEAAPVAWTSLSALTAVSEGRSAWMFPAKEGDDLRGSIPLYTNPGAQTSELEAELARALAQIESLEAECDRRHAALQRAPAPGIAEAAKVLLDACPNPIFDHLKPVLMGEVSETIEYTDEDGEEAHYEQPVSWTAMKKVITLALRALSEGRA